MTTLFLPCESFGSHPPGMDNPDASLRTTRVLSAPPHEVFEAFEQAESLARWWGPAGFTNSFETFEFQPGGDWVFTMHAPNGASFLNRCVFREIERDVRIVLEHVVTPWFRLTVTLVPQEAGRTRLDWVQEFESPEVAARMSSLAKTANEQVLDRLEEVLAAGES